MPTPTPVSFVVYESPRDPTPHAATQTWAELGELLTEVRRTPCAPCPGSTCPHKLGEAWSPVVLTPGATRSNAAVVQVTAAVLDLDHLTLSQVERVAADLEGLAHVLHTTHSHRPEPTAARPEGDWCLRVVLPLSRPVPARDWPRLYRALVAATGWPADPATKDLARLYFLPTAAEGVSFFAHVGEGEVLQVEDLLQTTPGAGVVPLPATPVPVAALAHEDHDDNEHEADAPVDLGALRKTLVDLRGDYRRRKDTERADLLDRVLEGKALAAPGTRDHTLHKAASILACALPAHTPADAALAILRPSLGAMDTRDEGLEHWLQKAEENFARAQGQRVERDAQKREAEARMRTAALALVERRRQAVLQVTGEAPADSTPAAGQPPEVFEDWAQALRMKPSSDPEALPRPYPTEANVEVILSESPDWKGCIRFNDVRKEVEVVDLPGRPAPILPAQRHLDVLPRAVGNWLQSHPEYQISLHEGQIASTLLLVARTNLHDPVKEYLTSLKWDGKARVDTFLEEYAGAAVTNASGEDITAHVRRVSAKWLVSCAARGLRPGAKVDTVLILESAQGKGKSSLFEALGGEYYAVARVDVESKDALLVLARSWIVELAELTALRKADTEAARAFFSTRTDHYRLPYGRAVSEVPRRCVFAGTTNPTGDGYLADKTGNRRFWPVAVSKIDLAAVRRDRDQVFAEAVVRAQRAFAALDRGEQPAPEDRWWLDAEEAVAAEHEASERSTDDVIATEAVLAWWQGLLPSRRPVTVRLLEVAKSALQVTPDKLEKKAEMRVGQALRDLGFQRSRVREHNRRVWVYQSTEALRALPYHSAGAEMLKLQAVAKKDT